jgi:hypothetical protein
MEGRQSELPLPRTLPGKPAADQFIMDLLINVSGEDGGIAYRKDVRARLRIPTFAGMPAFQKVRIPGKQHPPCCPLAVFPFVSS